MLYDVTADVPEHLLGDSFRIKQVLINLVGNAIKFTDKGEILISIRSQSLPEGEINLSFSIKDTGIGITLEQQNALFPVSTSRFFNKSSLWRDRFRFSHQ